MRINLGCGRSIQDGWVNVDIAISPLAKRPPEILADVRSVPLPDGCADEIMAIHIFEHFALWECAAVIGEWRRLLKVGGLIALEMPDIIKCCHNIINGVPGKSPDKPYQLGMWGVFGENTEAEPLMGHKWGWTFSTLKPFLAGHGFAKIREQDTRYHYSGRLLRDFRVEAIKT